MPRLINVILQPWTGLDIETFVPGLPQIGWRMGFNVPLGIAIGLVAILLQKLRRSPAAALPARA